MRIQHEAITLTATDGTALEGRYSSCAEANGPAILITHGANSDHAGAVPRWLGDLTPGHGQACLALDRRDRRESRPDVTYEDGFEDLRVGLDFLQARGHEQVALCGHSKGTLYPLGYLEDGADPRIVAVGLFSVVADNHESAREAILGSRFPRALKRAEDAVRTGDADALSFPTRFGQPLSMTGDSFLSFFGTGTLAVPTEQIKHATVPVAVVWSERDTVVTPEAQQRRVCEAGVRAGVDVTFLPIPDANHDRAPFAAHDFEGIEDEAARRFTQWLGRVT